MSKDHVPSDFARSSGYKSDLENAETGPMVKSVNTSFGSKNHNAYIMRSDGTHEHFYYSPKTQKSGWHGHNYPTKNNHPDSQQKSNSNGGKLMDRNSFIESIRVDKATINKTNQVSQNFSKNMESKSSNKVMDNGGRERGDTGPMSHGREGGNKAGLASHSTSNSAHSSNGQGSTAGGQPASSGHGTGGQGSGGHGSSAGGQGGY